MGNLGPRRQLDASDKTQHHPAIKSTAVYLQHRQQLHQHYGKGQPVYIIAVTFCLTNIVSVLSHG